MPGARACVTLPPRARAAGPPPVAPQLARLIRARVRARSGASHVFAASDRPTIIYSSNRKLLYSNLNENEARAPRTRRPARAARQPRSALLDRVGSK